MTLTDAEPATYSHIACIESDGSPSDFPTVSQVSRLFLVLFPPSDFCKSHVRSECVQCLFGRRRSCYHGGVAGKRGRHVEERPAKPTSAGRAPAAGRRDHPAYLNCTQYGRFGRNGLYMRASPAVSCATSQCTTYRKHMMTYDAVIWLGAVDLVADGCSWASLVGCLCRDNETSCSTSTSHQGTYPWRRTSYRRLPQGRSVLADYPPLPTFTDPFHFCLALTVACGGMWWWRWWRRGSIRIT